MSQARTQDQRHWIQVGYKPTGDQLRSLHLDLNMVDHVMVVYGNNPDDPQDNDYAAGVRIYYAGTLKPIDLDNWPANRLPAANDFYQMWKRFITLREESTRGILGVIHLPDGGSSFK